jgi:Uncharacterized protein conserved in bacteria (DUF2188)
VTGRNTKSTTVIITGPHPNGGWQNRVSESSRAAHIHPTEAAAEMKGKEMAKACRTELIIQGKSGQIQRKDSYGHDPIRPRANREGGSQSAFCSFGRVRWQCVPRSPACLTQPVLPPSWLRGWRDPANANWIIRSRCPFNSSETHRDETQRTAKQCNGIPRIACNRDRDR